MRRSALIIGHHQPLIRCIAAALGAQGSAVEQVILTAADRQALPAPAQLLVNECLPPSSTGPNVWGELKADPLGRCFETTQACFRPMCDGGFGRIVTIVSIDALTGRAGSVGYSAAASALRGFTRTLALEGSRHGVTANILAIGGLQIPHEGQASMSEPPVGRYADLAEIARAVAFLCAEDAGFITGSTVVVDGGLSMTRC